MIDKIRVGPIGLNCYFVKQQSAPLVIVDPGAEARSIAKRALELQQQGLVLIVLTHGHLDHTGALPELKAMLEAEGATVRVGIHRLDAQYLGKTAREINERIFRGINALGYFRKFFTEMPEPDFYFEHSELLPETSIQILHTPGHTQGSCSFYIPDEHTVLTGDTLFLDGRGRTDNYDSDEILLLESITQVLFSLPGDTRAFPGHGDETVLQHEKRYYTV
ncbi:MAG TPA: MBL fold metallo-hydrolase [Spirochaetales bacterium]|nr:MBL fold metallo-hydrolase [Spirochaetales bacterium]HQG40465.1 MBL fold metallo-hydrolase [Spirochaetales bacterium]HQK34237.1 MBL fold metallo-hydrolase [Spirochaetales bacterium]